MEHGIEMPDIGELLRIAVFASIVLMSFLTSKVITSTILDLKRLSKRKDTSDF